MTDKIRAITVLHAQLILQLQSFPCDPKYIDLYIMLTLIYLNEDPSVLDDRKIT